MIPALQRESYISSAAAVCVCLRSSVLNITVSVVSVVPDLVKRFSEETLGRKILIIHLLIQKKMFEATSPTLQITLSHLLGQ